MSTTEHLDKILAKIDRLLEMAGERTQGKWDYYWDWDIVFANNEDGTQTSIGDFSHQKTSDVPEQIRDNMAFISSCAGNAEAGWRATKAAIECYLAINKNDQGGSIRDYRLREQMIQSILAAWPVELLD